MEKSDSTFGTIEDEIGPEHLTSSSNGQRNGKFNPKSGRYVNLVMASTIKPKRTRWMWDARIPLGELVLMAGREGIGKSTVCYQLAADITRGTLPGEFFGVPRGVIVVAAEDSWERTIVPRLLAANADMNMVYKIVVSVRDVETVLTIPDDIPGINYIVNEFDVGMVLLDPLISVIEGKLDIHKESDVRKALEPTVKFAQEYGITVLGIIHLNKDPSADAMTSVMGSRAFGAIPRAVIFCMIDPEDDSGERRLLAQGKNNLGTLSVPTLSFKIVSTEIGVDEDDGYVISSGKVEWLGEIKRGLDDFMNVSKQSTAEKSATSEAAEWLSEYLENAINRRVASSVCKKDGKAAGHSEASLKRVLKRLSIIVETESVVGKPRLTYWRLP